MNCREFLAECSKLKRKKEYTSVYMTNLNVTQHSMYQVYVINNCLKVNEKLKG